jgi:O-antigen/teichoic acid export membrane protein
LRTTSSLKKILKNAGIILSGNMGANIFGLLSTAIFTHSLGAEIFGYYVLFLTFIEIINKIFNFQTWQAFIKFATDFQVEKKHRNLMMLLKYCFIVDLISLIVATLTALSLSGFLINFFDINDEYYSLLLLMSLTILFKITEISTGVFRLFDRFRIQAKIVVYGSFIKFVFFSIIALADPIFQLFVYATVISQFIIMGVKYYCVKSVLNENNITLSEIFKEKINMTLLRELKIFSFIVYNNFDVAIRMVSRQLDTVILGKIYGAEIVGIYKIAKEIANLIGRLTDPIYQAIYPEFAKLLSSGKKLEAKDIAKKISVYAGSAGFIFYGIFVLFGEWAISLAFGEEFLKAYNVTLIYFFAILIAVISLPLVPILHSKGLAKQAFLNQFFATLGYCVAIYPLTLYFSAIGASMAYIIFYIIWLALTLKTLNNYKVFE